MQANKLFDLGGKVALVTGGSRGIGFQMAEALGEMGCKLAMSARKILVVGSSSNGSWPAIPGAVGPRIGSEASNTRRRI
jgi:short-subunit dehydrogenase involved in D-alanine esterification of teichoic acids